MTDLTRVRLYLVRHGESEANRKHLWQGWGDAPLTASGREQARRTGRRFRFESFAAVWSSDRLRALQTAKELLAGAGIQAKVSVDYRLRERFYGGFENLKTPQILELFDEGLFDAARDGSRMVWRPRGGETFVEVLQRLDNFILDHVLQPRIIRSGLPVLISTHGNILRLLHARAKALPEPHLRVPVNGGLLTLDLNVTPDSGQIQFVVVDEPEWEE